MGREVTFGNLTCDNLEDFGLVTAREFILCEEIFERLRSSFDFEDVLDCLFMVAYYTTQPQEIGRAHV